MPYLVLGEDGRPGVDGATRAASELFGLGGRKRRLRRRRDVSLDAPLWGQLGQVVDAAQAAAAKEYAMNAKAAEQVAADVARLRPANFKSEVERLSRAVRVYLDHYEKFIHGKTGNEEAERQLRHMWVAINRDLAAAIQKWPSVTEQTLDKVIRFIEDFAEGVSEAWKSYMTWALNAAGDTLRIYHESRTRVIRLKQAKVRDPKKIIPQVERRLDMARAAFLAVAEVDLDEIAQKEYGAYPALGQQVPPVPPTPTPTPTRTLIKPSRFTTIFRGVIALGALIAIAIVLVVRPLVRSTPELLDAVSESTDDIPGIIIITVLGAWFVFLIAGK
jgi:hypothetical protein